LIDRSLVRSRAGVKAVAVSLAVAGLAQVLIFVASGSLALLADLIHNFGDAVTAIPLGIALLLRSFRGEKLAGEGAFYAAAVSSWVDRWRLDV
jgi:Co/Zn/Cd efflux system component